MSKSSWFAERLPKALRAVGVTFEHAGSQLRIPALHEAVGDLVIAFDNDEITVFIGKLTHCHFTPLASSAADDGRTDTDCIDGAADYLRGIVNNEWVIWVYPGRAGGCYRIKPRIDIDQDAISPREGIVRYLWSGPLSGLTCV